MTDYGVFSLAGQRALITGSSAGLGFEIAKLLASAGAEVWVNGRQKTDVHQAVEYIGVNARSAIFDVADHSAVVAQFNQFEDLGGLDILVNNVGLRDRRNFPEFTHADVTRLLDVDLVAPFFLAQSAARLMEKNGYGRIINISSLAGLVAQPGDAAYTTAKSGLIGMTRALSAELGPKGINVNAVAPGFFRTSPNQEASKDPALAQRLKSNSALGRWGEPAELAPTVLLLASKAASYLTGQVIAVDGGYSTHY
ncbi:SDR family oxidoreductase [Cognatishimia sp. WU-CL00825]|uniref:SDR family oxidoreductase n=1 Tax=Cognatishimia sp. WU-CL00825 TaxID=3127658 RepID=UPI0031080BBE